MPPKKACPEHPRRAASAWVYEADYGQLVKIYGEPAGKKGTSECRYSPAECTGTERQRVEGSSDPAHVSTSHVERQNLTMRMQTRRFVHKSLRMSPAMAAGVSDKLWSMDDLCATTDAVGPKPGPRGPCKKAGAGSSN